MEIILEPDEKLTVSLSNSEEVFEIFNPEVDNCTITQISGQSADQPDEIVLY